MRIDVAIHGRQHPIAFTVNKPHVLAGIVVHSAMSLMEHISVVRNIVLETSVDSHFSLSVDELDATIHKVNMICKVSFLWPT